MQTIHRYSKFLSKKEKRDMNTYEAYIVKVHDGKRLLESDRKF